MVNGRRIFADFKVFSRGYLRNKFGLFFGLIFPVILILIFGAIFSGGSSGTLYVYAQNRDNGSNGYSLSTTYLEAINKTETLQVITLENSVNFTTYMSQNSIENGLTIPEDFTLRYATYQPVNVTVYINPSGSTGGTVIGIIGAINNQFNLGAFNGSTLISITQQNVGSGKLHRLPCPWTHRLRHTSKPHVLTR